jgi:hypothetical protein
MFLVLLPKGSKKRFMRIQNSVKLLPAGGNPESKGKGGLTPLPSACWEKQAWQLTCMQPRLLLWTPQCSVSPFLQSLLPFSSLGLQHGLLECPTFLQQSSKGEGRKHTDASSGLIPGLIPACLTCMGLISAVNSGIPRVKIPSPSRTGEGWGPVTHWSLHTELMLSTPCCNQKGAITAYVQRQSHWVWPEAGRSRG